MFEVGKFYTVKMWDPSGGKITEYGAGKVIEETLPLVKFKGFAIDGGEEVIINTASLAFVSAQPTGG
jgi:hypothetical protein